MLSFVLRALLLFIFIIPQAFTQEWQEQEIQFREQPNALFKSLLKQTNYPLDFKSQDEFEKVASSLSYQPQRLHRDLELLARLTLEANVKSKDKYQIANNVINQLELIAVTPFDHSMVIMLQARYMARKNKTFNDSIDVFNQALARVSADNSPQATMVKYIIHEQLSSIYQMLLRPIPALSHLNQYREIAYQLRNDYFISSVESALGSYYNKNNDLTRSLQHYSEAFRIANRLKYPGLKARSQHNLAKTYRDLEQWDDALKHAHNAVSNYQKLDQQPHIAESLNTIAIIYKGQLQWHKAIDYYLNAVQVNTQIGNEISLAINYHNLAESFAELNDTQAAIDYLQKANEIFAGKKLRHYLVYNELLFAKVTLKERMWKVTIVHAEKALEIAKEKSLVEEQIEALNYLASAYQQSEMMSETVDVLKQMLALRKQKQQPIIHNDGPNKLTEQKLKFELGLLKNRLDNEVEISNTNYMRFIMTMIIAVVLFLVLLAISKQYKMVKYRYSKSQKRNQLEPTTSMLGFHALMETLSKPQLMSPERSLSLLCVENIKDDDINLGLTQSIKRTQVLIEGLEKHLDCTAYLIRPGLVACYFSKRVHPEQILQSIKTVFTLIPKQQAIPRFHAESEVRYCAKIGHINLPLLDNPDILIPPQLQFETVQFALAAAKSLPHNNTYVALKTLNFAPAALFSHPLYLNLNQALNRGILRAESNYSTEEIQWPTINMED
ncbi:tetratricopeptide repeat protein [Shewanella maritima]|uniref:tetratricopeptide repeat protein n=1 Tax=Shewanella maritima TaxID=2520507 RepID=UPI0037356BE6